MHFKLNRPLCLLLKFLQHLLKLLVLNADRSLHILFYDSVYLLYVLPDCLSMLSVLISFLLHVKI